MHPYYLVYVNETGEVLINHVDSKKILDSMRALCKGITTPITALCEQVNRETDEYHKMDKYSDLLKKSISSILKKEEEKEVLSLFRSGGTSAISNKFTGIEDFKLISFLIVKS